MNIVHPRRIAGAGIAALALAACVSACGGSGGTTTGSGASSTPHSTSSAASTPSSGIMVPAKYASNWNVPTISGYPPFGYLTGSGQVTGVEYYMGQALAKALGVKPNITQTSFANELIGASQGKYVYVEDVNITPARAKQYDFVTYFNDNYRFLTKGKTIGSSMMDVCGLTVAAEASDVSIGALQTASKACVKAGKPAIKVDVFPDQGSATVALQSGRVDAESAESAGLNYIASKTPGLKVTGPAFLNAPLTFATVKGNGLDKVIAAGLKKMMADGAYMKVLSKYHLTDNAIKAPQVNPAP
jgi:polar amino acid transport system substrate-binding protein